ncbi:MAG: protein phosphatase 2C domain-containing protein [Flammeovirgaceae bacterium]
MKIYSLLHRGDYHPTCCEDFLLTETVEDQFFVAAVMDGCSNGKESHFASTLMAKIIRKACKIAPHTAKLSLQNTAAQTLGKWILRQLFIDLNNVRETLFLERTELLATLILLVYQHKSQEAFIISLGDGVIAIDGEIQSIDQQNMPDYISYHLSKDFEEWYARQKHVYQVTAPKSISISTDGIESFMTKTHEYAPVDVPRYLLHDLTFAEHKNMLGKKTQVLYAEHNISPKDDLGIVRLNF